MKNKPKKKEGKKNPKNLKTDDVLTRPERQGITIA